MSVLDPKFVRLAQNGTRGRQMHWNLIWKRPGLVPFGANLTHFGAKPTIPDHQSAFGQNLPRLGWRAKTYLKLIFLKVPCLFCPIWYQLMLIPTMVPMLLFQYRTDSYKCTHKPSKSTVFEINTFYLTWKSILTRSRLRITQSCIVILTHFCLKSVNMLINVIYLG